jgi:virginiamycin B lyase
VPARLAVTEDAVWVLCPDDGSLSRIDPVTNELVATIPVGRGPSGLAVGAGAVWVTSSRDGTVARIDPASNRLTIVPVPRCCGGGLAAGERALWAANRLDGTLVRLDPATGRVVARVLLPRTTDQEPHQVAVGDGAVGVTSASPRGGTANLLWRVDPASNQVTSTTDLGPTAAGGLPNDVAAAYGAVWAAGADLDSLFRVQPG